MAEREEAKEEEEEKWVKYYSSFHQILLVGEGDFSFSMSLALSFASATNIVASSLDSYGNSFYLSFFIDTLLVFYILQLYLITIVKYPLGFLILNFVKFD